MMSKQYALIILLQINLLSVLHVVTAKEQVDIEGVSCRASDDVDTNSIYHSNIVSLLGVFTHESSKNKLVETSWGGGPGHVNGLYVCRPDLNLETCNLCVNTAVLYFNQSCSNKKQAIVWYDKCMVRYTNLTISGSDTVQAKPFHWNWSNFNVSKPDTFLVSLNKTLDGIITKASLENDRFAFIDTTFTPFEGLHGMGWCTNISTDECKTCLKTALDSIPGGRVALWAYVVSPSCALRYDTAKFIYST